MELKEWMHWTILFFVVGGMFLLFLNRPNQTSSLFKTGTTTLQGVADVFSSFGGGGGPPIAGA